MENWKQRILSRGAKFPDFFIFFKTAFSGFSLSYDALFWPKNRHTFFGISEILQNPLRLRTLRAQKNSLSMARLGGRGRAFFPSPIFLDPPASRRGGKKSRIWYFFLVPGCIYVIPDIENGGSEGGSSNWQIYLQTKRFGGVDPPVPEAVEIPVFRDPPGTRFFTGGVLVVTPPEEGEIWPILGDFREFSGNFRCPTPDFRGYKFAPLNCSASL